MSPRRRSRIVAAVLAALSVTFAQAAAADTLTLAQAIEMGLSKSPTMRGARARTDSADAGTSLARAGYWPSVTLGSQAGYSSFLRLTPAKGEVPILDAAGNPIPSPTNPRVAQTRTVEQVQRFLQTGPQIDGSGSIRWTVFDFGKTPNNVGAADANFRSSTANEKETAQQQAGIIANAYLTLFYQEKLFEVATATLESREKLFAIAKGLVKAGIQPPVEELRSQSRVEGARRDQARAKAALEDARLGLAMLLGYDQPSSTLRVTTPRLSKPPSEQSASIKEAEQKRQSIVAAEEAAESRREAADAASAGWFPSVFLIGNASLTYLMPDGFKNTSTTRNLFGGAGVSWTLDLSIPARIDQANAEAAAAEANLEDAKREARTEAGRAAILVKMGEQQLEHAKRAEESASGVRAVIEARYIRGLSNPLELIEAEDSDLTARVTRLQTELDHANAVVRLCVATGRPITDDNGGSKNDKGDKGDKSSSKESP